MNRTLEQLISRWKCAKWHREHAVMLQTERQRDLDHVESMIRNYADRIIARNA